ncbi:hypothetical protein [Pseudorhodoplanes sinuspersici]|uniref:Uncharacterized protein n=1 Tax=Pseudorhodoplanes sinuspersici TaxID=1235591 RepID=A0A1W6ZTK1_9HYPH|nr:hypothetical protein [Pseudorhodoplanes sinuspersici]ARQ00085.1 hypothetical protein CAK95_14080 [Pseudorhodoplanes sinuspersici]RKE71129.1 hypothetical protein DFP91_3386 [Pseudorhodoplanes sinuspersici]
MEPAQPAEYPLYFVDGDTGMSWSIDTRSVRLDAAGVTFTSERETRTIAFREIRSIRLQTTFVRGDDIPIGICTVRFGNYRKLTIFSGDSHGRADADQRQHYIDFIRDFHRRIPMHDRNRIGFNGGLSETRYMIVSTAMLAGALLFGALPAFLILWKPSFETFGIAFTSGGFVYAGWRVWNRNRPGDYSPDHVPDDLLP